MTTPLMSQATYEQYLLSPEWQCKRRVVLDLAGGRCAVCGRPASNVHHNTYVRLGQERLQDLVVLCSVCHRRFHSIRKEAGLYTVRLKGKDLK